MEQVSVIVGGDPVTSVGAINDWGGGDLAEIGKGSNIPGGDPFDADVFDGDVALFNHYGDDVLTAEEIEDAYRAVSGGSDGGFQITTIEIDTVDGSVTLKWNSKGGATYAIDSSATLENTGWGELADGYPSDGEETSYTDKPEAGTVELYYRVREEPRWRGLSTLS